jgi:hypothetical protein
MAHYYFDIVDGQIVPDPEGREIDGDLNAVRSEALADAREMIAENARDGVDVTGRWFEIRDQDRRLVLKVLFAEALRAETSASRRGAEP